MIPIGPQIAFVDDVFEQIRPLYNIIRQDLNTGAVVYNASPEVGDFPTEPVQSVRLIFLDLYYNGPFDAEISAQWVSRIISPNTIYALVIWSRDTDKTGELLAVLQEDDLAPAFVESWQKTDFNLLTYDFKPRITSLIEKVSGVEKTTDLIVGQIIDIEEDGVLVKCKLFKDKPIFQVRKFDKELFSSIGIANGLFIRINITTQSGTRIIEILGEHNDLSEQFKVVDRFEGLKNTAFFIED